MNEMQAQSVKARGSVNSGKKWLFRSCAVMIAVVALPYLFSRVASPYRRIQVIRSAEPHRSDQSDRLQLRILTYNIAHGRGLAMSNWDGGDSATRNERLSGIAQVLHDADADVVILNEVDFNCSWSNGVNQAAFLAKSCGYPFRVEQRNLDVRVLWWTWKFGNAILSKYPLRDAEVVDLPGYSTFETIVAGQKRAVSANVVVGGHELNVTAVHLCHRSELIRTRSAEMIASRIRATSNRAFVLAGDFNSSPSGFPQSQFDTDGNNAIESLDAAGIFQRSPVNGPPTSVQLTFDSEGHKMLIDWILIPKAAQFERYTVVDTSLSDHKPVWADITIPE